MRCLAGTRRSTNALSSVGRRLAASRRRSPVTLATSPFCADTGNTRAASRSSVRLTELTCLATSASISASVFSASHSPSILLSTAMWLWVTPSPTMCRQTSRSLLVTPVSAASTNKTACALGTSDSVSSGSVPIAFSPGVSRMTRPCLSSGCGKLMTAWRQREISTSPSWLTAKTWAGSSGSYRPYMRASSTGTRTVSATSLNACSMPSGESVSTGNTRHSTAAFLKSDVVPSRARVSMGSARIQGGRDSSCINSVGHMVVRPADDGRMRRP